MDQNNYLMIEESERECIEEKKTDNIERGTEEKHPNEEEKTFYLYHKYLYFTCIYITI